MVKMNKFQIWIVAIGMIGVILTGAGLLIRNQLLDPGNGGSPITIPTNGDGNGDPVWYHPVISLDSIRIKDLDEDQFKFEVYVTNTDSPTVIIYFDIRFYVDGTFSHIASLGTPTAGYYIKNFYKTDFSGVEEDSEITIDLILDYRHERYLIDELGYPIFEIQEFDVVDAFSFVYTLEDPEYEAPEITDGTFQKSVTPPLITFQFAVSDFELVNSISYYFMVGNDVVQDSNNLDIIKLMTSDVNGVFTASFDYTLLGVDLEKTTYISLIMNFVNEDSVAEDRDYKKFSSFEYGTEPTTTPTTPPTNGFSINYIFIIITVAVFFTSFIVIRKIKTKKEMND
ncbi:MAG: hypothetical protein E3J70_01640 [Candidatus Heimdallarchaeota archaeon]|nr:MAG: hypothetical protein E3J70_01640 [Candidatus Heimdallarchaeota archaeon]